MCALQWSLSMDKNPLLTIDDYSPDKSNLRLINELIIKFKNLNVDASEFTFLKAIILFKSGKFLINLNLKIKKLIFITNLKKQDV